jgi:PhoPQ-activated pathogenicity-related protein
MFKLKLLSLLSLTITTSTALTALDDYIRKAEPKFSWRDTGRRVEKLPFGSTAVELNVTSLEWLDVTKAIGPNGALWTHQVMVVLPETLKITNITTMVMTGGCNEDHHGNSSGPAPVDASDEYLTVCDNLAHQTGAICVAIYQIPNCHIVYPSDPSQKRRSEDSMIAWAWNEYIKDPKHDPEWLPRLPMAKAGFQCMKAVEQYLTQEKIANTNGWVASGASKRGWTSWMVGAATPTAGLPLVLGIAPLVPIVPDLVAEIHRQWMSYNGFTFAFEDYVEVNLTQMVDSPDFAGALKIIDPMYYGDRLGEIPKVVVLSSDDEFMQMDWSDIWYDKLTGEKHLLIAPNSEHSLATGIPEILATMSAFVTSLAHGKTERPNFEYERDTTNGAITVTIPEGMVHGKVVLRHAQTMQSVRRDFRWIRLANNDTEPCTFPEKNIPPVSEGGGNCFVPIIWYGITLKAADPTKPNVYTGVPPAPKDGKGWTGYFVEIFFPSDTGIKSEYQFTTPGFAWPDTLPFKDCSGETCVGRLV